LKTSREKYDRKYPPRRRSKDLKAIVSRNHRAVSRRKNPRNLREDAESLVAAVIPTAAAKVKIHGEVPNTVTAFNPNIKSAAQQLRRNIMLRVGD